MCKPCTTAAGCKPARPSPRPPTQAEELAAVGRAMADAALVFDQAVTVWEWAGDGTAYGSAADAARSAAVRRAAELMGAVADLLAPHFPKRFVRFGAINTAGHELRDAAEQMDRLDLARGFHGGFEDERGREYHQLELYPHLLRERSERDPAVCPLCGSGREEAAAADDPAGRAWCCRACGGDLRRAKRVLRRLRANAKAAPARPPADRVAALA